MDGSSQTEHDKQAPDRGESPHPAERPGQHEQAFSHFDKDDDEGATQIDHEAFEVAELPTEIAADFPQNPVLLCIKGKDSGKDFTLQSGDNSVGRSLDNDIILSDVSVSRRHFELSWDGQTAKVRDLGSGNGTQLNGSRIHEAALEDNDVVSAGETEFRFRTPEGVLGHATSSGSGAITATASEQLAAVAPAGGGFAAPPAPGGGFAAPPAGSISTQPKDRYRADRLVAARSALGDKIWLVVGGALILLIGAIITTYTYLSNVRAAEERASQNAAIDEAFGRGVEAFENRNFDDAYRAFEAVLRNRKADEQAVEFMRRASQARKDEQTLIAAQDALLDGDVRDARQLVESVDRNSEFARDFSELRIRIKKVDALRTEDAAFQEAVREGEVETAERSFDKLERLGADDVSLRAYRETLETLKSSDDGADDGVDAEQEDLTPSRNRRARSRASASRAPSSTRRAPRRAAASRSSGSGGSKRRVVSLFAAGRFSDAAKAADSKTAGDIRAFETYYKKASGTPSRRNLSSLREAVRLDKKISGGKFSSKLRPKLVEALLDDAKFRLARKDDGRGCARVGEAKRYDPSNAEIGRLERLCVGRAIGLAKKAKSMEATNPSEAQVLYRRVLSMGPDSSLRRQVMDSLRRLSRSSSRDDDE